jgi:hypothetical protein
MADDVDDGGEVCERDRVEVACFGDGPPRALPLLGDVPARVGDAGGSVAW